MIVAKHPVCPWQILSKKLAVCLGSTKTLGEGVKGREGAGEGLSHLGGHGWGEERKSRSPPSLRGLLCPGLGTGWGRVPDSVPAAGRTSHSLGSGSGAPSQQHLSSARPEASPPSRGPSSTPQLCTTSGPKSTSPFLPETNFLSKPSLILSPIPSLRWPLLWGGRGDPPPQTIRPSSLGHKR